MQTTIPVTFDDENLQSYTDQFLATLWHVSQANSMNGFENPEPGRIAERIGREIIRRFVTNTPPELWAHQGCHFDKSRRTTTDNEPKP